MKKFTTILMGLSLLVVGCIGFLGCADNNGPGSTVVQGTPVKAQLDLPSFAPANPNNPHAVAHPANGGLAVAELGNMIFYAPVGYTLSLPPARSKSATWVDSQVIFGSNVSGAFNLQVDGNGNLETLPGQVAELPAGVIDMYFSTVIMTFTATGKTCTIKDMTVEFTVSAADGGFWTLPLHTYLTANRLPSGLYLINGSLATGTWPAGSAPTTCVLSGNDPLETSGGGMELIQSGSVVYVCPVKTFTSNNSTVNITGQDVVPFDTFGYPKFTFTQ